MKEMDNGPAEQLQQQQPAGHLGEWQQRLPSSLAVAESEQGPGVKGLKLSQSCSSSSLDQPDAEAEKAVASVMLHQLFCCPITKVWL